MSPRAQKIFVTGGTGFMGRGLIPQLLARGHEVTALARSGSASRLPAGCRSVIGDVLAADTYREAVGGAECMVHLTGVAHPSPAKARQFVEVDLASARTAIAVAVQEGVKHFVYLSVAQPAPVMRAYVEVRRRGRGDAAGERTRMAPSSVRGTCWVRGGAGPMSCCRSTGCSD